MSHTDPMSLVGEAAAPFVVRPMAGPPAVRVDLCGPAPRATAERLRDMAAECSPPGASVRALGRATASTPAESAPDDAPALAAAMIRLLRGRGFDVIAEGGDHRFLIDLSRRGVTTRRAERALADIGVAARVIALSELAGWPAASQGVAVDTAFIAGRGLYGEGARHLAAAVADVLDAIDDPATGLRARREVRAACERAGLVTPQQPAGDRYGD